jgi:hypothetical protein
LSADTRARLPEIKILFTKSGDWCCEGETSENNFKEPISKTCFKSTSDFKKLGRTFWRMQRNGLDSTGFVSVN